MAGSAGSGRLVLIHVSGSGRDVGKTLLGETLTRLLAGRGWRVCAVKHVHHGVDFRVKDTGRYLAAGARVVAALGPDSYMAVARGGRGLLDAVCWLASRGCTAIVVEGFREQADTVLGLGGCTAYLEPGSALIRCGGHTAGARGAAEAAGKLAELVGRGCCTADTSKLAGLCVGRGLFPADWDV